MGSLFAPSMANLFIAHLEEEWILNKDHNHFFKSINIFVCYIDDCFCVFEDPEAVDDFVLWLNGIHDKINFTHEGDKFKVNFLDTTVYRTDSNQLAVRPFIKPTDKNTYLHFKSYHTRHLRNNIPYGQFLLMKRNSTEDRDIIQQAHRLRQQFLQRVYPSGIICDAEDRAWNRMRASLFHKEPGTQAKPIIRLDLMLLSIL